MHWLCPMFMNSIYQILSGFTYSLCEEHPLKVPWFFPKSNRTCALGFKSWRWIWPLVYVHIREPVAIILATDMCWYFSRKPVDKERLGCDINFLCSYWFHTYVSVRVILLCLLIQPSRYEIWNFHTISGKYGSRELRIFL